MASDLGKLLMGRPCQCCGCSCDVVCGWRWTDCGRPRLCRDDCPPDAALSVCRVSGWNVTLSGDARFELLPGDSPLQPSSFEITGSSGAAVWIVPLVCGADAASRVWYPDDAPFLSRWSINVPQWPKTSLALPNSDVGFKAWLGLVNGPAITLPTQAGLASYTAFAQVGSATLGASGEIVDGSESGPVAPNLSQYYSGTDPEYAGIEPLATLHLDANRFQGQLVWDAWVQLWQQPINPADPLLQIPIAVKMAQFGGMPSGQRYMAFGVELGPDGQRPLSAASLNGIVNCDTDPGCDICGTVPVDITVPTCYPGSLATVPRLPAPYALDVEGLDAVEITTLESVALPGVAFTPLLPVPEHVVAHYGQFGDVENWQGYYPLLGGFKLDAPCYNDPGGFYYPESPPIYSRSYRATYRDFAYENPAWYDDYEQNVSVLFFILQDETIDGDGYRPVYARVSWEIRMSSASGAPPVINYLYTSSADYECEQFHCDQPNTFAMQSETHQKRTSALDPTLIPTADPNVSFPDSLTVEASYVVPTE
jgi:hypothetical protein